MFKSRNIVSPSGSIIVMIVFFLGRNIGPSSYILETIDTKFRDTSIPFSRSCLISVSSRFNFSLQDAAPRLTGNAAEASAGLLDCAAVSPH